jgi:hypothetical protein
MRQDKAATHQFPAAYHDRVISRFGVMFFDNPTAAFTNLRRTLQADGRMVVAVWQPRDASEFQSLAVDIAVRVAGERGHRLRVDPPNSGPFAYGSAPFTTEMLEQAGWTDIAFLPHDVVLYVGGPGSTPEAALDLGRSFGPLADALRELPPSIGDAVVGAVLSELRARWDGIGIPLQAAIAIVTATPAPPTDERMAAKGILQAGQQRAQLPTAADEDCSRR